MIIDYAALVAEARIARERAYAPYSRFSVGAALLSADGRIFHGCNIENASYPVTLCAERSAFAAAWSAGVREVVALAVVADTAGPVSPCGMCRQTMFELAPDLAVLLANLGGHEQHTTPRELLPGGFGPDSLLK
ncbi:MAG: cytidine deaminase [Herpetosiphonaceae bacterium]|nr:cytidine deaminase [Herpetosiphonaceae bacterium]